MFFTVACASPPWRRQNRAVEPPSFAMIPPCCPKMLLDILNNREWNTANSDIDSEMPFVQAEQTRYIPGRSVPMIERSRLEVHYFENEQYAIEHYTSKREILNNRGQPTGNTLFRQYELNRNWTIVSFWEREEIRM